MESRRMDDIQMELYKRKEKFFNAIRFILMKNARTIETPQSNDVFKNKPRMQIPRPGAKWKYPNGRRNMEEVDKKELAFSTSNLMGKLYGDDNENNSNQLGHNGEEPENISSFLNEEKPGRFLNYVKNCLLNPEAEGNDGIQQKDNEHKKAVKITR